MSDEIPIVDCHECKDLEFARNLARSMKEGYGRHNSNLSFRDRRWNYSQFRYTVRENRQARVIGQIRNHVLRDKWEDCDIGDAVSEDNAQHFRNLAVMGALTITKCMPASPSMVYDPEQDCAPNALVQDRRTFERVAVEMCESDRHTEYFWKRIS